MPTLTRLAALMLFGLMAYVASVYYLALYEERPDNNLGGIFMSLVAAVVGWKFVGTRAKGATLRNFTIVVQGVIATYIISFILYGFYNVFTDGYAGRYKTFDDALQGVFRNASEHAMRMADLEFLIVLLTQAFVVTLLVTGVFRFAEARRFER